MERRRWADISNVRCSILVKIGGYNPIRLFEAIALVAPAFGITGIRGETHPALLARF